MTTQAGHTSAPRNLCRAGARDAWKRSPVALETCWTFRHWKEHGGDVDCTLEEALRWHASVINAKSSAIPAKWRDTVAAFRKRLGYRYVLHNIIYPESIRRGESWSLQHWWVNRGVAPCYAEYRVLLRLAGRDAAPDAWIELPHPLSAWLPGDDQFHEDTVRLPAETPPRVYRLHIGIVRPGERQPAVRMASAGRDEDGWLPIGDVTVTG